MSKTGITTDTPEVPKYRKKSKGKGLPRTEHKHLYETVLLTKRYNGTDFKTGRPRITEHQLPTKVCTICGRIEYVDRDPKYYIRNQIADLPFIAHEEVLSEEALKLPQWLADDFFDKFARRIENEDAKGDV
jgi:hypothetical protein